MLDAKQCRTSPVLDRVWLRETSLNAGVSGVLQTLKKHLKNEQGSKDAAAKKDLIQVE